MSQNGLCFQREAYFAVLGQASVSSSDVEQLTWGSQLEDVLVFEGSVFISDVEQIVR